MDFRIGHMEAWTNKQLAIASSPRVGAGVQTMLFDPIAFGGINTSEGLVLEAVALQFADLVMGGDLEYLDAVYHAQRDGVVAVALVRRHGCGEQVLDALDDVIAGLGDRVQEVFDAAAMKLAA
ncbi:hypothetical protein AQB9606_04567 [Aquabacterium sp. CECT 9606]|nr:hypothetical protein AQB9606_04567 [Aquabacterium sp. CECT 9606]